MRFQNAITLARNNIFSFRKELLIAGILLYQKQTKKKWKSTSDPPASLNQERSPIILSKSSNMKNAMLYTATQTQTRKYIHQLFTKILQYYLYSILSNIIRMLPRPINVWSKIRRTMQRKAINNMVEENPRSTKRLNENKIPIFVPSTFLDYLKFLKTELFARSWTTPWEF